MASKTSRSSSSTGVSSAKTRNRSMSEMNCASATRAAGRWAKGLAHATGVGGNHRVRDIENRRRGAIVLLEPHDRGGGIILVEVEDVAYVGTAPAVNRLVIVADDTDVAFVAGEQPHKLVLRAIRVLILVDEHIAEARPVRRELRRVLAE